ncbi:MAG: hypothetical protein ABH879_02505 [archaeon]
MMQKIRDLMRIKDEIQDIKVAISSNTDAIKGFEDQFSRFTKEFADVREKQRELISSLSRDINVIRGSSEELKEQVYEFKVLKSTLQRKILSKFEEEIKDTVRESRERLEIDTSEYDQVKDNIKKASETFAELGAQISKYIEIGRQIKKEDYELDKFAKQILKADREKIELIRKIEVLERLISKERRRR